MHRKGPAARFAAVPEKRHWQPDRDEGRRLALSRSFDFVGSGLQVPALFKQRLKRFGITQQQPIVQHARVVERKAGERLVIGNQLQSAGYGSDVVDQGPGGILFETPVMLGAASQVIVRDSHGSPVERAPNSTMTIGRT